ncbi:alpha-galactosidase [Kitasatospora cheerisanensis]|uniref:Alpha-galactosidase n=1 Tax=Kitasatospora cheerisanensis KCTC 2395 TaxID=1348663 RepID=A0A066Z801_9ACTN|nr:RICIN domain-containing protein [Kitasatospora cheerisanensis]KDN86456.1 putative glycoside hydrolase [Kitasatospora cheerisanensis KCTC 2395]
MRPPALRPLLHALAALSLAASGLTAAVAASTPAAALDNGRALTPPMGWNSWNTLGTAVTQQQVVQTIDFMSSKGLVAAGYDTVTIDDGWSLSHRDGQTADFAKNSYGAMQLYDADRNPTSGTDGTGFDLTTGHLIPDPDRFPARTVDGQTLNGIQYLSWYAHSKGMKFGLYATGTYTTCQGHPGSLGHESTDAADFVAWGVDFVKYDDCPYGPPIVGPDGYDYGTQGEGRELTRSLYARTQDFQRALDAASAARGRPRVVLSVSAQPVHTGVPHLLAGDDPARTDPVIAAAGTPARQAPGYAPTGIWCGQVANLCRIGGDRGPDLEGVLLDGQLRTALQYPGNVRPGSWNDLDMMFAGWLDPYGLYGTTDTCTCHKPMNDTESRSEMSILAMTASPLISGADLRSAADSQHSSDGYTWSTGISDSALAVYKNADVIAVDQDSLGKPATLVGNPPNGPTDPLVLKRQLANGDTAVLLVNQDPNSARTVSTTLGALGLTGPGYSSKELWTGATGDLTGTLGATLAPHGTAMYRLRALPATVPAAVIGDGRYHGISAGGTAGQALEVRGICSAPDGSTTDINTWWDWHTSERWRFDANADGTVHITDDCFTDTQVHGTLTGPAAPGGAAWVLNRYDPDSPHQKWRVVQNTATGALTITNVATGLALDAPQSAPASAVVLDRPDGSAAGQSWSLLS